MQAGESGIQYGTSSDQHQHDDDMAQLPSASEVPATRHMVQVAPYLDDQPEARQVEYWQAVGTPNGSIDLAEAFVAIYRPDGSMLERISMSKVECSALGDGGATGKPLEAAVHTGQMTPNEAGRILELCLKREVSVYRAVGRLSIGLPAGDYRFEATAFDEERRAVAMAGWLDILQVAGLKIDFSRLDFGEVEPNGIKRIEGDTAFNPPNDGRPTVRNSGNAPMHLNLRFSEMVGTKPRALIDRFDAKLNAEKVGPFAAGPPVCFSQALSPGQSAPLDINLYPASILPIDSYQGNVALWGSLSCSNEPEPVATPAPPPPPPAPLPPATVAPAATATAAPQPSATPTAVTSLPSATPTSLPGGTPVATPTATPVAPSPTPIPTSVPSLPTATPASSPAVVSPTPLPTTIPSGG